MTIIIIGIVLSLSIVIGLLSLGGHILRDFFENVWNGPISILSELIGSEYAIYFVSLFTIAGMILVVRFVMSRMGENPGHSANS